MGLKHSYTKEESNFITTNYPVFGSTYIIKQLNITYNKLNSFIHLNKLKINRNEINIDLKNKYLCYVLGIIWADGTVSHKEIGRIHIKLVKEDIENIEWVFLKLGTWKKILCKGKNSWKDTIRLSKSDKKFKQFLFDNDYDKKSYASPDKILELIPEKNIKYFLRGIFDGDGCFFVKNYERNDGTKRQAFISSTYEQDWKYMEDICNKINCKFKIKRIINNKQKNYKSSCFAISSGDIIRFGNYIYEDFFGLDRKYKKFIEIKESYIYLKCRHD